MLSISNLGFEGVACGNETSDPINTFKLQA